MRQNGVDCAFDDAVSDLFGVFNDVCADDDGRDAEDIGFRVGETVSDENISFAAKIFVFDWAESVHRPVFEPVAEGDAALGDEFGTL